MVQRYPIPIGLYYSAMTGRLGLRPMDEEYILMGMAGWGRGIHAQTIHNTFVKDMQQGPFQTNKKKKKKLTRSSPTTSYEMRRTKISRQSTQRVVEKILDFIMNKARQLGKSRNLVYMGGVALNCLYNRRLGSHFDNIWIMPNPGDCGSSLGAPALIHKKQLNWIDPYVGTDIPGEYSCSRVNQCFRNKQNCRRC